jgi:hypothetical protein
VIEMSAVETDPYLWLEAVNDDEVLDWVRKHNQLTLTELCGDRFERMRAESLEILDTDDRIPYPRRHGEYLYNYWVDAGHPRGLWRRTTLAEYSTDSPEWDVIIDVDALAARRRELGLEERRRYRTRIHPCLGQPVSRWFGCGGDTRIRHDDKAVRRRRVHAAGSQDRYRLGRPGDGADRHGFR